MNKNIILVIVVVIILGGIAYYSFNMKSSPSSQNGLMTTLTATTNYFCSQNKTITANFYKTATTSSGSVILNLSDSRQLNLQQTVSADGGRYANSDESIIFWSKGRGLTFTENGQENYSGCLQVADDPGGLTQVYVSTTNGFSLRFPVGFITDENYIYQALGPSKNISGVKFTIPSSMATGTNLSKDSYLSVEKLPNSTNCLASEFLSPGTVATTSIEEGTKYSIASSSDAGAGNRYVETVYSIPGTNPCLAIRYFVHYSVFENYPTGSIKEFIMQDILNQFNAIRKTLLIQ